MIENYVTIKKNGQHTIVIKKSQFICTMAKVINKQEADDFIYITKLAHPKATHTCYAYLINLHNQIQRKSDGGEPSGTAGVPILEVLKRSGVHNIVVVVTRYFGGIKLGSGGLIRAYSNATSTTIESIGLVNRIIQTSLFITVTYANFDKLTYFLQKHQITISDTTYTETVTTILIINKVDISLIQTLIKDLLNGQVTFKLGGDMYKDVTISFDDAKKLYQ